MKKPGSHGDTDDRSGTPRPDQESAHSAFLEARRLLRDASAGTPVLELEWSAIQGLCRDSAQLFGDLPLVLGQPRPVELPRRWWQRQSAVEMVDQKYLTAQILLHPGDPSPCWRW